MGNRICSIEACRKPELARGWCSMHYARWRKTGDPLMRRRAVRPTDVPFPVWFRAQFIENGDCFDWTRATNRTGYGVVGRDGAVLLAHRVAWELTHGTIPDGLHVLHRCDRPVCGNVAHLFLGTPADNARDKVGKGRQAAGMRLPQSRLMESDKAAIVAMRAQGLPQAHIAAHFGVHPSVVSRITTGKTRRNRT